MELAGARALVVGSSTGIGRALALALASAGADVTATVRPGRAGAAAPALRVVELDVADDAAVRRVVESIAPLDLVVYNAGYGVGGVLEEVDDATLAAQYEVNVFGLWRTVRASLPGMRVRGRGAIVVIGSFGSRMPFPGIAAYRSSKAAVAAICGGLHLEVAGFGIRVLHVQPGLVRSSFEANMVEGQGVDRRGPYAAVYDAAERAYPRMSPVAQSPGPWPTASCGSCGWTTGRSISRSARTRSACWPGWRRARRGSRSTWSTTSATTCTGASGPHMSGVPWTPGLELGCPACGWTTPPAAEAWGSADTATGRRDPLSAGRIVVPADPGGGAHRPGSLPLALVADPDREAGLLKLESRNPTGSHKDRSHAVVAAIARHAGAPGLVTTSTGNHGVSCAAHAASEGLRCVVCSTAALPRALEAQIVAYGGVVAHAGA